MRLSEKERNRLESQMLKIVQWVDKLRELEIDDMKEEAYSPVCLKILLREDTPCPSLPANKVLSDSPDKKNRFIKVPRVIE